MPADSILQNPMAVAGITAAVMIVLFLIIYFLFLKKDCTTPAKTAYANR
jgi:hypothetical protein